MEKKRVYFGLSDGFAEELFECSQLEKEGYTYVGSVKPYPGATHGYFLYKK